MVRVRENMTGWIMNEHGFPNSRITVVKQAEDYVTPKGEHFSQWWCTCSCGKKDLFILKGAEIRCGDVQSCGCLRVDTHKKYNRVILDLKDERGLYGIGYCSNTNCEFYFDMDDYDKIKDYCWYEIDCGEYHTMEAWDKNLQTQIKMHWLIVDKYYDHADRNPFNNRKYNLRPATASQNSVNRRVLRRNTSGFIGLCWEEKRQKWKVTIGVGNKKINLGRFLNKEDAIKARLKAEKKYFGEFAPQKHLFEEYGIENVVRRDKDGNN